MTQSFSDVPRIIVFPPIIPLVTIFSAVLLQWLRPLALFAQVALIYRASLGIIVLAAGIALLVAGTYALSRNDTAVKPSLPTTKLVTAGVYAHTRNPFYVGGSLGLLGIALTMGLDWLPILYVGSFVLLHFGIVLPEEEYLDRKFGDAYRQYKAAVPRYFAPF
jgi:protein-S-isoprenylcysteine O-methyltransferase Ste14